MCFGVSEEEAIELALLVRIASGGSTPVAPNTPSNLDISITSTNGSTILTWSNSDVPTTNQVWRSKNGGAYALLATVGGGVHTYTDTDVLPALDYWSYKVRACNGALCSAFTNLADAVNGIDESAGSASGVISFPTLIISYGTIQYLGNLLTSLSFPLLKRVIGDFALSGDATAQSFSFPSLVSTTGTVFFDSNPMLTSVTATALQTVGGALTGSTSSAVTSLSFPALVSTGNTAEFDGMLQLASFSAPNLVSVGGAFTGIGNIVLNSFTVTSLQSVVGNIDWNATNLVAINLPAFQTLGGNFEFDDNHFLTSISFPVLSGFVNGVLINCLNNALADTTINAILALGVASAVTTCDFELSGGANSAPTGQGVNDKTTLQTAGNTVNTN